ncbi:hypothetical protein QTI66_00330 [Variovorax sp. J22R133]|uniref:DUF6602 domain-containing protein n=1 Tax=Variovorax brevis TaxID=3053503 RepID=UPI002578BA9C|nr:DUF6602 domain-containing protein [Variovorax sp. J22R133]MDM0110572.1 hypothetical protein [Variovorax sp. J22R133]
MANAVGLKELFASLQAKLAAELQLARATIGHPGDKGGTVEANWLTMLRQHLPERYRADKATVIDSRGHRSDSIDIVIYDRQYSHLVMQHEGFRYVPAEAVYAVFEVKQSLDKAHLEYAGAKAASVRALYRTSAKTVDIRGETPAKPPIAILAGLLCTQPSWTPPFGDAFAAAMAKLTGDHAIDLGCVATAGAFQVRSGEIKCSAHETALAFFLFALLNRLQEVGTVAPIDFLAYMEHL